MTSLAVFQFENDDIRFVDGKPVANDIAKILGYKNPADAIYRIVSTKNKGLCDLQTPSGTQSTTVLEEAGIYQLIFSSKLELAEKFQDWVFSEVLPTLRKTGKYEVQKNKQPERQLAPVRDIVDYANAGKIISSLPDSHTKRLLDKMLVKTLTVLETNEYLANKEEKPLQYTTAPVRAKDLGYSVAQIKDGSTLGKYVKKFLTPAFQDYSGQFLTYHYEINKEFDDTIHAYFNRSKLTVTK